MLGKNFGNLCMKEGAEAGFLITWDGVEDDKTCFEGLPNYQVPQPLEFLLGIIVGLETISAIGTDDGKNSTIKDVIEEMDDETPNDADNKFENRKHNQTFYAPYCQRKLCALYETGWHRGRIDYYNETLCQYHVPFDDSSKDYIREDGLDMADAIFC